MLAPVPSGCSLSTYPPAGGDGTGSTLCDEWPYVSATTVKGCTCPPAKTGYVARKSALFLNVVPFFGQIFNAMLKMPKNCQNEFKDSSDTYTKAQTKFVALITHVQWDSLAIVEVFTQIYSPDTTSGKATGILPATIAIAMQPGIHTSVLLGIVAVAVFCVLLGVLFTL